MSQVNPENMVRVFKMNTHKLPDFKENRATGFVEIGKKNDYPEHLLELYSRSSTHRAIINSKCNYIVGSGIDIKIDGLTTQQYAELSMSIKKVNPDEDFNDFIKKVCKDWLISGRFAVEVIKSNKGNKVYKYHVPVDGIRATEDLKRFAYSPDWKKIKADSEENREKGYKEWDAYDPENFNGSQLFFFKDYDPSSPVYGLPEYQAALSWIEVDVNIADYFYNLVKNNFVAGYIVNVPIGTPSDEIADAFEDKFKRKFNGTENAGEVMIVFQEEGSTGVSITPINATNLDSQYENLRKDAKSNIFTGHMVTSPALLGVETDQPFGNRVEIRDKAEFFQNSYVAIKQRDLESQINWLFNTGDRIEFKRMEPIGEELSESVLTQILTNDELREKAGYGKLTETRSFSKDENIAIELFSRMGVPADKYETVFSAPVKYDGDKPIIDEEKFRQTFAIEDLSDLDKRILEILKAEPATTITDLSEMLKTPITEVSDSVGKLARNSYLEVIEVTESGEIEVQRVLDETVSEEIGEVEFEVRYRYITRPDVPSARTGSRDFCRRLMALNRLYTREEIDQISALSNRNVWRLRGGWYHNPNTDVNTPFCRHIWQSELVRKR